MKTYSSHPMAYLAKQAAVVAGALAFQYLFFREHLGLNLLLYVAALVLLLPAFYPQLRTSLPFLGVAAGTLLAAAMVVLHNSVTSKFAVVASFVLMLGMANQPQLRLLLHALANGLINLVRGVREFFVSLLHIRASAGTLHRGWYYLKLAGIPLVALLVFHLMFSVANARYYALATKAIEALQNALVWLLPELSIGRVLLLLPGVVLTAGSLFIVPYFRFLNREASQSENISRKRGYRDTLSRFLIDLFNRQLKPLDLKKEYLSAMLLLGLVNALLLAVNIIDINWLWFGFELKKGFVLSQFVHEGTYVLIFSILLAMAIVLLYFRGNLNFYRHNRLLKLGAYVWIVQNAVLAVSVGLRNYYYIHYCGLAYKRIGVIVFLLLTLFGLFTIFYKISQRKSSFFLLRTNTLAAYVTMLALTCINWDPLIARVNILHPHTTMIDYDFLLTLSDKALPVLYQNQTRLERSRDMAIYPFQPHRQVLHTRIQQFLTDYETLSWRSWNRADAEAYRYLRNHYKPASGSAKPLALEGR